MLIAASLGFAGLWIYVVTHAEALGGQAQPEALRRSIPGFTGGLLVYVAATVVAAFGQPLAALVIYGLLGVYYLFEHLPSPSSAAGRSLNLRDVRDVPRAGQTVREKFRRDQGAGDSAGSQILTRVP